MNRYHGKRVLHIGTATPAEEIVHYLKSEGAYVILAGRSPDSVRPFREIADETVCLDVYDVPSVITFAKEQRINAVTHSGSEASVEPVRLINEAIGNTYLHTAKQWQTFANKSNFRSLCNQFGLASPRTFFKGPASDLPQHLKKDLVYPVIVKPTDSTGGAGISICRSARQLKKALETAYSFSRARELIIEEYLDGDEVTATYVIHNGECVPVCLIDKLLQKMKWSPIPLTIAGVGPSIHRAEYFSSVNDRVQQMISEQGLNNCTVFFQTIYKDGSFYFIEAGLRLEGIMSFCAAEHYTGQNFLNFLVDSIVKVETEFDISKVDDLLNGHIGSGCGLYLKDGTITKVVGLDKVQKTIRPYYSSNTDYVGYTVRKNSALSRLFRLFYFDCSSVEDIIQKIKYIQDHVKVYDNHGKNMVISYTDLEKKLSVYKSVFENKNSVQKGEVQ